VVGESRDFGDDPFFDVEIGEFDADVDIRLFSDTATVTAVRNGVEFLPQAAVVGGARLHAALAGGTALRVRDPGATGASFVAIVAPDADCFEADDVIADAVALCDGIAIETTVFAVADEVNQGALLAEQFRDFRTIVAAEDSDAIVRVLSERLDADDTLIMRLYEDGETTPFFTRDEPPYVYEGPLDEGTYHLEVLRKARSALLSDDDVMTDRVHVRASLEPRGCGVGEPFDPECEPDENCTASGIGDSFSLNVSLFQQRDTFTFGTTSDAVGGQLTIRPEQDLFIDVSGGRVDEEGNPIVMASALVLRGTSLVVGALPGHTYEITASTGTPSIDTPPFSIPFRVEYSSFNDCFEPNDSLEGARQICIGGTVDSLLFHGGDDVLVAGADHRDTYKVHVDADGVLLFQLDGTNANTLVAIFDESDTRFPLVSTISRNNAGAPTAIAATVGPGTYILDLAFRDSVLTSGGSIQSPEPPLSWKQRVLITPRFFEAALPLPVP
jgi:hypothetical protein